MNIIYLKFRKTNKILCALNKKKLPLSIGDNVIVKGDYFTEFCTIVAAKNAYYESFFDKKIFIQRKATEYDTEKIKRIAKYEEKAAEFFNREVTGLNLKMNLISVKSTFDSQKLTFNYAAEQRLDFRILLKKLIARFAIRIELHQLTPREKSAFIGGVGVCGRELCCKRFLDTRQNISMKTALEQKLQLEPSKLSGVCSKLKCCLKYESYTYKKLLEGMPKIGETVGTKNGLSTVVEVFPISQKVKITTKKNEENVSDIVNLDEILF